MISNHTRTRSRWGMVAAAALTLVLMPSAVTPALAEETTAPFPSDWVLEQDPVSPGGAEVPEPVVPALESEPADAEEGADPGASLDPAVPSDPVDVPRSESLPDVAAPATSQSAPATPSTPATDAALSALPAPASREKRVIGNVHTDTVSAFVDSGRLTLDSKADVDGQLGKRLDAQSTLFHLIDSSASRAQVPSAQYGFIGSVGSDFWLAPQTQDRSLIWPGFSTEDPALRSALEGGTLKVRLLDAAGPGRTEIYLQESFGPKRIFSSAERLPDWTIGVPQHTHMNWAFTQMGTYTLTFEVEAVINGAVQTAQNTFTFVVGSLDAHTARTSTSFGAEYTQVLDGPDAGKAVLGEPITFTAAVGSGTPNRPAVGAVQFRDDTSGAVLGHAPVTPEGTAVVTTAELPSGEHEVVAEFVPTWSNDFTASESESMSLPVSGEARARPAEDDTTAVSGAEIAAARGATTVTVTTPNKSVQAGQLVTGVATPEAVRGEWVSVWLHASRPVWLGWTQTTTGGWFSATVPQNTAAGQHRVVLKDRNGAFVGWDALTVTRPSNPGGGGSNPGGGGTNPGGGNGGTVPPPAEPVAPTQQCVPEVVLDHGHIDAFNVSAGGGQAVLQIKEDVTGSQVIREVESVLLRVKESAYGAIPSGIVGAPAEGYMLPLTMDPNLIWPGWDTNRTTASGFSDVSIHITAVNGPGQILMATQGSFGGWAPILTNGYALPGTLHEPTPAHTHAAWVFSAKGIYTLTANAVATNPANGQSLTTATHTYMFQVGDVPLDDTFCGISVDPTAAAAGLAVGNAVKTAGAKAVAESEAKNATNAANPDSATTARNAVNAQKKGNTGGGGGVLDALLAGEMHPAAIAGVVGGGVLLLSGITGGTIWYVRRLGAGATSAIAATVRQL